MNAVDSTLPPALARTATPSRVLPSLNADGSRHRIRPRPSPGRFWRRRRVVAYALIALFVGLPLITIDDKPAMLIDLARREIVMFGSTFRPGDAFLLLLFGLSIGLAVFLTTALAGRVWCGWACPQTVWLEWVFRPIERLLEGGPQQQRAIDRRLSWRRVVKWAIYLALAFLLAHTFLAYFVTSRTVLTWVSHSPAAHPVGFTVVVAVTGLMFLDFAWVRDQTCTIACPYGRLQSVLLDRASLIVAYDERRGEPRGKVKKSLPVVSAGDCVDCGACVTTCPTGIDIRQGLQMECIACAQCVDACDAIMDRLQRPRGLIRYTSKAQLAGERRHLLRARTVIYPVLLAGVVITLVALLGHRAPADVWVLRGDGSPFQVLDTGEVSTPVRLRVENRTEAPRAYTVAVADPVPAARFIAARPSWSLAPAASAEVPLFVISPRSAFTNGRRAVQVRIRDDAGFDRTVTVTLLGPEGVAP